MIVGLGYKARSGKDLAADYLVEKHEFIKIPWAKKLKDACREIFGLTEEQLYGDKKEVVDEFWGHTPRYILQFVGTDCLRNVYRDDIWVKAVEKEIKKDPMRDYVIPDCRFPNEAQAIKDWGGVLIRVDRNIAGASGGISKHASETSMENYDGWDYIINNNGTIDELYEKMAEIIYYEVVEK